ncbi:MAG: acetate kinase, partial [Lachnospiraceae bacterium]|nr:acetate kinase [Lachnospiraceae bacterium]
AIVEFLGKKLGKSLEEVTKILNKESGVYGLSGGVSSDFRDLSAAMDEGNLLAKAALETYCYRVAKYIGSYVAAMNGVDIIAFTAGIGENDARVRGMVGEYFEYLGTSVDPEKNKVRGEEAIISNPGDKVTVMVVPTNEELAIARETVKLV